MPGTTVPVVQLIAAPPFGILTRDTGPTLAAGQYTVKRIRGLVNVDAFGISFSFITIPAAFGWTEGLTREYEDRIVQWAPLYTDLAAHDFYASIVDVHQEGLIYFFPQAFPTQLDIFVTVGCVVTVQFLTAF
jgi:hypothetical protein